MDEPFRVRTRNWNFKLIEYVVNTDRNILLRIQFVSSLHPYSWRSFTLHITQSSYIYRFVNDLCHRREYVWFVRHLNEIEYEIDN